MRETERERSIRIQKRMQQWRQCIYNLIMRHVSLTIVAVEEQKLLPILSMPVEFVIQHATRMRHIAICALPRSTIFFHIISQTV